MDRSSDAFFQLPVNAIGRIDIGRLVREMDALDNFMAQAAIREPGTALKMPKTSKLLDDIIQINRLNVLLEPDRQRLALFLKTVYKDAPIMHMSFSADPSAMFMQRLMTWIRQEIHPLVLVQIGLQPNIGAGCVIRTNNKYFDMSLRSRFMESRDLLAVALNGQVQPTKQPASPVAPVASAAPSQGATS